MEKMEKDRNTDELERTIKKAFGFDEDQLLQELHMAKMAIHDDELPEKSAEDFEKAVMRMEMDALRDRVMEAESTKGKKTRKKKRILKTAKVMVVAAALAIAMFGMTIVGVGGKHYYFQVEERDSIRNNIVFNNDAAIQVLTNEEEAYSEIQSQLNMDALKVGNCPDGMKFKALRIENKQAFLTFTCNDSLLYLYQSQMDKSHSYDAIFDGEAIGQCKNEWLNKEFTIIAQQNENGWEYAVKFADENSYFVIQGHNLTLDEFMAIVSDLHF